jgi:exonuclease III
MMGTTRQSEELEAPCTRLRIATLNPQGLSHCFQAILDTMVARRIDVLMVQEADITLDSRPSLVESAKRRGYLYVIFGEELRLGRKKSTCVLCISRVPAARITGLEVDYEGQFLPVFFSQSNAASSCC